MTLQNIRSLLAASMLLIAVGLVHAVEPDAVHEGAAHNKGASASAKDPHQSAMAQRKKGPPVKLVDINGAKKAALKKLPGITDVEADKIIANRPYGSKTWLVTNSVLDRKIYGGISGLIEAKQPYKTAAENAAMYEKLKKEKATKP